jgi:xylulokinase
MLCGLADAVDALVDVGVKPGRIMLVGGAAANSAVAQVAATLFDAPIEIPTPGEYVADGAARQAAWAVSGAGAPPSWNLGEAGSRFEAAPIANVREAYAAARDRFTQ